MFSVTYIPGVYLSHKDGSDANEVTISSFPSFNSIHDITKLKCSINWVSQKVFQTHFEFQQRYGSVKILKKLHKRGIRLVNEQFHVL